MPRVLVVDDDPQVLKLLRVNFELEGYDVLTATNGEEALDLVGRDSPDAIVCDVMMPGIDGLEVVRRLRAQPDTAGVPLVVVSAKAQRADVKAGLELGADAYVTKPFDPSELLTVVSDLLAKRRK
ncbi:MAG: response regulator transcription factor [Actinomycetota bacterium]